MRIIENIERISIDKDTFWLMGKSKVAIKDLGSSGQTIFNRSVWSLIVDDIKQVQDQQTIGLDKPSNEARTLILFDKTIDCEVDEDKKRILCGKNPAKMHY